MKSAYSEFTPIAVRDSTAPASPKTARFFRITFPEKGKPVLNIGPGDHSCQRWHLSMDDLKSLVRDSLPELLR